jgi:hypothetical protein
VLGDDHYNHQPNEADEERMHEEQLDMQRNARQALALDPGLPIAYAWLGNAMFWFGDLDGPSSSPIRGCLSMATVPARMVSRGPPWCSPGDVYGAAEVIVVLRSGEPTRLAGGLAGCSAPGSGTVALMPTIARIRTK